jgi:DNA-binding HxlR family transcriptional regulator
VLDAGIAARPVALSRSTAIEAVPAAAPGATPEAPAAAPNAMGAALGLLGDEWSLLIIRHAFIGARRFVDFKQRLAISDAVLTARLVALVDGGVLRRVPSPVPGRHEYALTRSGIDLWQLLLAIWAWEQEHVEGQAGRLPHMVHTACGQRFRPLLHCAACSTEATVDDVDATFGPSGTFARSLPAGTNRRRPSGARSATAEGPDMFPETMAIIGSRWSSATVGAAFMGATRFVEFERLLGAPPTIVSDRLRRFVELGVLEQVRDPEGPDRASYRLSTKGRALFGVVATLLAWGERWLPAADGPAVVAVHRRCGHGFRPELACSACRQILRGDVTIA